MSELTRREWFSAVAGAGIFGAVSAENVSSEEPVLPVGIVDAHVHVWSCDTKTYPLAAGFTQEDLWFPSYSAEELLADCRPAGVTRVNLVQMTWYALDHRYLLDCIARDPEHFVGTGIVPAVSDVALASPDRTMVALSQGGIYAFRIRGKSTRPTLGDGPRWMDHPGYDKMFTAGSEHNLALSFLMTPDDLPEVDRMCKRYPECPVIVDHFCLIGRKGRFVEEEIRALCRLARHRRVLVKLGAFYGLGAKQPPYLDMLPLIRRVVECFGPERCMWESDAPLQAKPPHTFHDAVAVIGEHADFLSPADKEQILVKTAEDFFFKR